MREYSERQNEGNQSNSTPVLSGTSSNKSVNESEGNVYLAKRGKGSAVTTQLLSSYAEPCTAGSRQERSSALLPQ